MRVCLQISVAFFTLQWCLVSFFPNDFSSIPVHNEKLEKNTFWTGMKLKSSEQRTTKTVWVKEARLVKGSEERALGTNFLLNQKELRQNLCCIQSINHSFF